MIVHQLAQHSPKRIKFKSKSFSIQKTGVKGDVFDSVFLNLFEDVFQVSCGTHQMKKEVATNNIKQIVIDKDQTTIIGINERGSKDYLWIEFRDNTQKKDFFKFLDDKVAAQLSKDTVEEDVIVSMGCPFFQTKKRTRRLTQEQSSSFTNNTLYHSDPNVKLVNLEDESETDYGYHSSPTHISSDWERSDDNDNVKLYTKNNNKKKTRDNKIVVIEDSPQKSPETAVAIDLIENDPKAILRNNQVIVYKSVSITAEDISRLERGRCLNDTLIDFYLNRIYDVLTPDQQKLVYIFNTFFYSQLKHLTMNRSDCRKLLKWTKGVDLFSKDFLFVPIHESHHWTLVIVCSAGKVIEKSVQSNAPQPCLLYLDSLGGGGAQVVGLIREYLNLEMLEKHGLENVFTEKTLPDYEPQVPGQRNSSDCGVFVLQYVEEFCQNPKSPNDLDKYWFSTQDIKNKRNEIKELLENLAQNSLGIT
eukprot:TRINITY_DN3052_c0_g1_i2.p1 TRINITY_DN3052_c0_g1~~TRINITY_DN3052_c0_g1_i2.p1  ORF type:complete len:474 (+),score=85.73 TRINITY_DN3052_c0_g1_i2:133-1554(+)